MLKFIGRLCHCLGICLYNVFGIIWFMFSTCLALIICPLIFLLYYCSDIYRHTDKEISKIYDDE